MLFMISPLLDMPERNPNTKSNHQNKKKSSQKQHSTSNTTVETTTAVLMGLAAAVNSFLFGFACYTHGAVEGLTDSMDRAIRQYTNQKLTIQVVAAIVAALPLLYYIAANYVILPYKNRRFKLGKRSVSFSDLSERMIITLNPRRAKGVNGRSVVSRRPNLHRARLQQKFTHWGLTLRQLDPRLQIFHFFNEVAAVGASKKLEHCKIHSTGICTHNCLGRKVGAKRNRKISDLLQRLPTPTNHSKLRLSADQFALLDGCFDQASVFTVWRPTSEDAIRKMMSGEAVGKGLDIKGKSAKRGKLSALVPVLQIHSQDDKHKNMLRHIPKEARMRVYYQSRKARTLARTQLAVLADEMVAGYNEADRMVKKQTLLEQMLGDLATPIPDDLWEQYLNRKYKWEMEDPAIRELEPIGDNRWGLDLPQRLFVEAYIIQGDIYREPRSPDDTGRPSVPSFQDMNLETLRKPRKAPSKGKKKEQQVEPHPVAFQSNPDPHEAMDPKDLVMAYEENGRVLPVVSDFDCFLVGTRRVNYKHALPLNQIDMMNWCVDNIDKVLEDVANQPSTKTQTWTAHWLEILKKERLENNFKPTIPKYGFADPKSYAIIGHAVQYLQSNGSVRHGAECFNYYFPQDLDEHFLVVSYDIRNGGNRWTTFSQNELLAFLSQKVDEGFMFPLNPKWILCDNPGWKRLHDQQLRSKNPSVQKSMEAWYPPSSGIREKIESVRSKYPNGFQETTGRRRMPKRANSSRFLMNGGNLDNEDEEMCMDDALQALENHERLQKAKVVFRAIIAVIRLRKALASNRSTEGLQVRGGSLAKGSLPPSALRVRVPKDALPERERSMGERSSSFSIRALNPIQPLLRSISFERFHPSGRESANPEKNEIMQNYNGRQPRKGRKPGTNGSSGVAHNDRSPDNNRVRTSVRRRNTNDLFLPRNLRSDAKLRTSSNDSVVDRPSLQTPTK